MDDSQSDRLIAKNSLIVYLRLFVATLISILTSRYVYKALGVSDYGLYNVVGGVIAMFSVIAGAMASTTIRFLNIEIGKLEGDPNKVFNLCQVTHIVFALIVLILGESIGCYYINNYLNVPPGKESDAMFVFQVSTIVACIGVTNVPYQSVFVAKEKFFHIAVIDIINALVKLGLVVVLLYYPGNVLRLYAVIMSSTTVISFVAYHFLCFKYWPELVRWKLYRKYQDYKELLVYNNYNLLASSSLVLRSQGSNMLINFFFGTIVNGAFGIARTVQSFVEVFTVNFDTASAPQITQSVGRGDLQRASSIASRVCRMCQLLSYLIVFPLFVEMEFVLRIWLGDVTDDTVLFCRVMLLAVLVASTGGGLLRLKDALGKIKWFMLTFSFWYLLTIPVGYVLFKNGYPPVSILVLFLLSDCICRISQLILMRVIYRYDVLSFIKRAYFRPSIILILLIGYSFAYLNIINLNSSIGHLLGFTITALVCFVLIIVIGINESERNKLLSYISNVFTK